MSVVIHFKNMNDIIIIAYDWSGWPAMINRQVEFSLTCIDLAAQFWRKPGVSIQTQAVKSHKKFRSFQV